MSVPRIDTRIRAPFKVLCSYHYFKTTRFADLFHGYDVQIIADSGGFSAWSKGITITCEEYAEWLHLNGDSLDAAITLDAIGNHIGTVANYRRLQQLGCDTLPVAHVGCTAKELDSILDTSPYVCLGGMVGFRDRVDLLARWCGHAHERARHYGTNMHGLGLTGRLAEAFPWYSIDSSSYSTGSRYGESMVWDPQRRRVVNGPRLPNEMGSLVKFSSQALAIRAYQRMEQHCRQVHGPIDRDGYTPGLHLYSALSDAWGAKQLLPFAPTKPLQTKEN